MAWTDPTLSTAIPIKAAHFNELRTAIENIKKSVSFTTAYNPTIPAAVTAGASKIAAAGLTQLRAAVNGYQTRFSANCDCTSKECTCQSSKCQSCQSYRNCNCDCSQCSGADDGGGGD